MKDDNKTKKQLIDELTELRITNAGNILAECVAEESGRYAESIVDTVREPLLVMDEDLKIITANRGFYRIFKGTPEETIGAFIYDLGNGQWDIPKLRTLLEEVLPEKEMFDDFEVAHDFQHIGHKVMLLNARQVYQKDIGSKMILLAIEDITEHKRLEGLLIDSEERYRRLFETASDGILLLEKQEGKIAHVNPAFQKMCGYTQKESIGYLLKDVGIVLDIDDFQTIIPNLDNRGIIYYKDVPVKMKSGQHIDTDIHLVDRARLIQCNIRDITTHKRAEEKIRRKDSRYRELVEHAQDSIFTITKQGQFIDVNKKFCQMLGYTTEECLRLNILDTYPDDIRPVGIQRLADLQFGNALRFERPMKRQDGGIVFVEAHAWKDSDGNVQAIVRDITERKRTEAALSESEEKYHNLFKNATEGIYQTSLQGRFVNVNPAYVQTLGYESAEELMESITDIARQLYVDPGKRTELIHLITEQGVVSDFQLQLYRKDGSIIWVSTNARLVKGENGKMLYMEGMVVDITARKELVKRDHLAREVLDILNRSDVSIDTVRCILHLIKHETGFEAVAIRIQEGDDFPYYETKGFFEDFVQAEKYLCARDEDGKVIRDCNDNPVLECMCGNVLCGRTNAALPFFTEGGSFWSNCTTELLASTTEGDRQARTRNRCNGEGYESVALIPLRSGDKIIGLLQLNDRQRNKFTQQMIQFFEGLGASIGIALSRKYANEDLQKKHMELKQAQAQVIQQEKMASIGQIAAGIAHEINNPMSFITGNLGILQIYIEGITNTIKMQEEILKEHATTEALETLQAMRKKEKIDYIIRDIGHLIEQSLEGADRVKRIVTDLKSFSRKDEDVYLIEDINAALESTINIILNEIKYKAGLVKEFGEITLTRCNISHLSQVFMNLLVNAAQAIEKWGKITVRTWQEENNIYVSVTDTGSGIPEEIQEKMFEPFFTTKPVGKGTGLGLSISNDIVKRHSGDITVVSKVGEGSTFTVRIPILRS